MQSQVRSNRVTEKVPKVPEKVWEALVQSQVRFNRVPEKVPEKVPGSLGAKSSQVQQGSGEGCRKRWCKAKSGSTGFRRRFQKVPGTLVQSQVRFNRVPEKVPKVLEKVPGSLGAKPGQVQQGSAPKPPRPSPEPSPER